MTYVSIPEAARLYRIHHSALYRWVAAGKLETREFRGKVYVHRQQTEDLIATRRQTLVAC